jgi:hypothetical protein
MRMVEYSNDGFNDQTYTPPKAAAGNERKLKDTTRPQAIAQLPGALLVTF